MSDTVSDPAAGPAISASPGSHATPEPVTADGTVAQRADSPADRFMRRLLRLPLDGPPASKADARRAFQTSILVTGFRCAVMYLLLPFVLPAVGLATDAAPAVVLPINLIAMCMIVWSMRRFWRADHPKRWWYTALGAGVIGFLLYFTVSDIASIVG